jgi:hypothetical protein
VYHGYGGKADVRPYTTHDFLNVVTCGLPLRKRKNRLFAMLAAHIDDSGSEGAGPVFVLGGYVGDTNQWKRFSDQWQLALDLRPKLKVLKIQEALRLEELWGRSKEKDRDERLKRFASIIHRHVEFGIAISSGWDDLRRIKKEFFPKRRKEISFQPYPVLFHGLMATLVQHLLMLKIKQKVDFVFDEQGALGHMALEQFDRIVNTLPPNLTKFVAGRPIHRNDEEVLPLQAAHTIAWLVRRYAYEQNLTGDLSSWNVTQPYLRKLRKVPMLFSWYPYERLAEYFNEARAELLAKSANA